MSFLFAAPQQRLLVGLLMMCLAALAVQVAFVAIHQVYRSRRDAFIERVRASYGDQVIALLADDADEPARQAFLAVLPPGRDERAIIAELLLAMVASVRGGAREGALALLREAGITEQYQRDLASRHAWRRAAAAEMLGEMAVSEALPALLQGLRDPSADVRLVTARALGRLGLPEAIESLLRACAEGLLPTGAVAYSVLRIGPAAGPTVRGWAPAAPTPEARALAAELLGLLRDSEGLPTLVALLGDAAPSVRWLAAASLGQLASDAASGPLLGALTDDDGRVRASAAAALGSIGAPDAVPALLRALSDPADDVATAAAQALVALGAPGREALLGALGTADALSRARAVEELERCGLASEAARAWRARADRATRARAGRTLRMLAAAGGMAPLLNAGITLAELTAGVGVAQAAIAAPAPRARPRAARVSGVDVAIRVTRPLRRPGTQPAAWDSPALATLERADGSREEAQEPR